MSKSKKKKVPQLHSPDIAVVLMHCKSGGPMRHKNARRAKEREQDWRRDEG